jgi:hypothetical protein
MLLEISLTCGEITEVRKTNYYRVTKKGNEVMSTAIKFRQITRSCELVTRRTPTIATNLIADSQSANEIFSKDLEQMLTLRDVKLISRIGTSLRSDVAS